MVSFVECFMIQLQCRQSIKTSYIFDITKKKLFLWIKTEIFVFLRTEMKKNKKIDNIS